MVAILFLNSYGEDHCKKFSIFWRDFERTSLCTVPRGGPQQDKSIDYTMTRLDCSLYDVAQVLDSVEYGSVCVFGGQNCEAICASFTWLDCQGSYQICM